MTPAIQLLLIQIMQLGAMLAANPRYLVFMETSGHVQWVEVRIYPAGCTWQTSQKPNPIATARARWTPYCAPDDSGYADELLSTQRELAFMRAALHAYLPSEPAEPEEPTSVEAVPALETTLDDDSLTAVKRLALHGGITELLLDTGPLSHSALLTVDKIDHPDGYALEATLAIHKQRHTLALRPADGIYMQRLCEWIEAIAHSRLAFAA